MSMKIKVYFDRDEELAEVVQLLAPAMKSCRVYEENDYTKAIIFLNETAPEEDSFPEEE